MSTYTINENGIVRPMTDAEKTARQNEEKTWNDAKPTRQLAEIRSIRNSKLSETDYLAMSDNTMSDEMKSYRPSMRDIPQDFSEDKYNELLARDEQGNLTHYSMGETIICLLQKIDASNLGGTTLPALNGSALTNISAGKVLQVVQTIATSGVSTNSTSFVDLGLSASITPSATSSKVLVQVSQYIYGYQSDGQPDCRWGYQLLRDSTVLNMVNPTGRSLGSYSDGFSGETIVGMFMTYSYLDSPSSTSSLTYKTQGRATNSNLDSINANASASDGQSTIILTEIGA